MGVHWHVWSKASLRIMYTRHEYYQPISVVNLLPIFVTQTSILESMCIICWLILTLQEIGGSFEMLLYTVLGEILRFFAFDSLCQNKIQYTCGWILHPRAMWTTKPSVRWLDYRRFPNEQINRCQIIDCLADPSQHILPATFDNIIDSIHLKPLTHTCHVKNRETPRCWKALILTWNYWMLIFQILFYMSWLSLHYFDYYTWDFVSVLYWTLLSESDISCLEEQSIPSKVYFSHTVSLSIPSNWWWLAALKNCVFWYISFL